jgi:hypothetical protein
LIDRSILESFDRALSDRAPAVRALLVRPGLGEDEVRTGFAAAGVHPSEDALAWWGYFDLTSFDLERPHLDVLPDFQFLAVEGSLGVYRVYRQVAEENARDFNPPLDPDDAWGPQWVPIFVIASGGVVALDCQGPPESRSPLRSVYPDTIFSPEHAEVFAPSLGDLLAAATRWVELGSCRYEPERRLWWPRKAWRGKPLAERFALADAGG